MKTTDLFPFTFPDSYFLNFERNLAVQSGQSQSVGDYNFDGRIRRDIDLEAKNRDFTLELEEFPTLQPALTPATELWLTIVYVTLYGLLFLMVYFQLWMIWWYRHKRLSYQTSFLFLCLIWTGLRTTLFAFYFNDCLLANNLALGLTWLLYCLPVCLQFTTLCLLVLFFAQVVFKARAKYEPSYYKCPLRIAFGFAIVCFFITNIVSAEVVDHHTRYYKSVPISVIITRVSINDSLFIFAAISLSVCIYKMSRMASAHVVLEAKGTTLCQALACCIFLILLFTSRAIYNLVAILPYTQGKIPSFGYNWVNVSDQADIVDLDKGYAYLSFGIVLFFWEFLPTLIIVVFFRVKKPADSLILNDVISNSYTSRSYFFDNPRRYDSDDDLTHPDYTRNGGHETSNQNYSSINQDGPRAANYWGTQRENEIYGNYSFSKATPPSRVPHML